MRFKFLTTLCAASLLWSCGGDSGSDDTKTYDHNQITQNLGSEIIPNALSDLNTSCSNLLLLANNFTQTVSQSNLEALRTGFEETYTAWQNVSVYNIGPMSDLNLRSIFNTYPTDTAEINDLFVNIPTSYAAGSLINSTGLPGLDYILFYGSDQEVLDLFNDANKGPGAKSYLAGVCTILDNASNQVQTNWPSYHTGFSSNTSTSAGSPFSELVNQFIIDVELMKNYQVGIPNGAFTPGITYPEQVEALYSNISNELFLARLEALENTYKGGTGAGFDDYLTTIEAKRNGEDLNTLILEQFQTIKTTFNTIQNPFFIAVTNENVTMNQLFLDCKLLVAYLKVDVCSAMGIQITFSDNDGD